MLIQDVQDIIDEVIKISPQENKDSSCLGTATLLQNLTSKKLGK
jgi:hypothetical protein